MARRILLADDSVTAQNMGRKILADAGYEVITVNNGSAALKKIPETRPDLVILDVYMPGYSGLEVCSRLKESPETTRTPVLLTVGKLEPFKPDEAVRVGADAFIVKPFEASELLSVLTRLEDKIVPRPEPSKPGRFARAIAAVEESSRARFPSETDSGWAKRIAFPVKKEPAENTSEDASALYNPVNRDLRTVVEPHPSGAQASNSPSSAQPSGRPQKSMEEAAAIPASLPADVTPEEIAALAAAAAQVQVETASPQAKIDVNDGRTGRGAEQGVSEEAHLPRAFDVIPAAAENTKPSSPAAAEVHRENGRRASDVPVTLATVPVDRDSDDSRWMAVPVQLDPAEVALSLEQEMQKTLAAFAAADAAHRAPAATTPTGEPAADAIPANGNGTSAVSEVTNPESRAETEAESKATASSVEAQPAAHSASDSFESQKTTHSMAAIQAVEAAINEFAAFAAQPATPVGIPEAERSLMDHAAAVADAGRQAVETSQGSPEAAGRAPSVDSRASDVSAIQADPDVAEVEAEKKVGSAASGRTDQRESDLAASTAAAWASWRQIRDGGAAKPKAPDAETDTERGTSAPSPRASSEAIADGKDNEASKPAESHFRSMRKNETEPAWAASKAEATDSGTNADHQAAFAAMAAAAGAEKAAQEADPSSDFDPSLTMIVDSVLNDLRPKIAEEIAKKLRLKK